MLDASVERLYVSPLPPLGRDVMMQPTRNI